MELLYSYIDKNNNLIKKEEIETLRNKINYLEDDLPVDKRDFTNKYKNFFYTLNDIMNTNDVKWLYKKIVPLQSIGVFFGGTGVGKTSTILKIAEEILINNKDAHLYFIDADMSLIKLKEMKIHILIEKFGKRFNYLGKEYENLVETIETFFDYIIDKQNENKDKSYIVIEDSLNLTAAKKSGFIDKEKLLKKQKLFRLKGGTSIILHHTNKKGVFADSQQIIDYADYSFKIERNSFNSTTLLISDKASRFDIKSAAFLTNNREVIKEVDFEEVNIDIKEIKFIELVIDLLKDSEMKQSEIIANLKDIRFFSEYKVGQKKATTWLKKWSEKGKWKYEQRASEKNAIYYSLISKITKRKTEKLKN